MAKIRLRKVHCSHTGEGGATKKGDDLFIKYKADGGLEKRHPDGTGSGINGIRAGDDWVLDLDISYNNSLRIDLYDNDSTSANDYLGYHNYSAEDASASHVYDTQSDRDGQYQFHTEPV